MTRDIPTMLTEPLKKELESNLEQIEAILLDNDDLVKRDFRFGEEKEMKGLCLYFDGLANTDSVDSIIETFIYKSSKKSEEIAAKIADGDLPEYIKTHILFNQIVKIPTNYQSLIDNLLTGGTVILIDQCARALVLGSKGWSERSVEEPQTEQVVRGPRDGFTENLKINTALVRRRLRTPYFSIKSLKVGKKTQTDVAVAYLRETVKDGLVEEVTSRINKIKIDGVLDSGYIEELITDNPFSPFTTVQSTERPDKIAATLLEGGVAIFVDNSPFVLTAPTYFWGFLQASDDYYSNYLTGSFYRMIRFIALLISLTLPSLYVILVSFHQEMIPTMLALTIASGREVVPFPVLLEAVIMEVAFELIREGGLRMPKPIGQAVSIVGSLVIGQAAVQAGILSPFMVIIVALTGIASFAIPNYAASFSIRLIRFPLLIASGILGLLGFAGVVTIIAIHALSLRSFGEAYLAPAVPFQPSDQKDSFIRFPWWAMKRQPHLAEGKETRTAKQGQIPSPNRKK